MDTRFLGGVKRSVAVLLAGMTWAGGANAALVTYYFAGDFSQIQLNAPAALAGANFAGTLVFDTAAAVSAQTANTITYEVGSAALSVQTALGGAQSIAATARFGQAWDFNVLTRLHGTFNPADEFGAGADASVDPSLSAFTGIALQLVDDSLAPLDDPLGAALSPPPTSFSLAAFEAAEFTLFGLTPATQGGFLLTALAVGNLDCLSTVRADCAIVPEPATLALLAFGLAGLGISISKQR